MKMISMRHNYRHNSIIDKKEFVEALRTNRALVLFSFVLIAGMILGAVFARHADLAALDRLDFLFYSNFKARAVQTFTSVFAASFASSFIFIFICFLCGLSMWGMFLIPAVLLFRGFGLGLTSGYLYAAYGLKGILFNFAVILPGAFVCCLALLLAAREGSLFSRRIASCATSSEKGTISEQKMKIYLLRFGAILALAFFAALIDVLFSTCFAGMFSF